MMFLDGEALWNTAVFIKPVLEASFLDALHILIIGTLAALAVQCRERNRHCNWVVLSKFHHVKKCSFFF